MDRRFLTVLGVSLVFALVVSSIFYQFTARSGPAKKAETTEVRDLIVTTRALGVGVMIRPADDHHLPTANTCISRLYVPLYSSKQILRQKLSLAIKARSFGFV